MSYREYTDRNGRLVTRRYPGRRTTDSLPNSEPDKDPELDDLAAQLKAQIGETEYYEWLVQYLAHPDRPVLLAHAERLAGFECTCHPTIPESYHTCAIHGDCTCDVYPELHHPCRVCDYASWKRDYHAAHHSR